MAAKSSHVSLRQEYILFCGLDGGEICFTGCWPLQAGYAFKEAFQETEAKVRTFVNDTLVTMGVIFFLGNHPTVKHQVLTEVAKRSQKQGLCATHHVSVASHCMQDLDKRDAVADKRVEHVSADLAKLKTEKDSLQDQLLQTTSRLEHTRCELQTSQGIHPDKP